MKGLSPILRSQPLIPQSILTVAMRFGSLAFQLISVIALAWASIDFVRTRDIWAFKSHIRSFWDEVERM
jgi:hypothetical protein